MAVQTVTAVKSNGEHGMARRVPVLFTNTSELFGSPMQVHFQILKHMDPDRFDLFVATNSSLPWRLKVSGVYHRLQGNSVSRLLIDIVRGGGY